MHFTLTDFLKTSVALSFSFFFLLDFQFPLVINFQPVTSPLGTKQKHSDKSNHLEIPPQRMLTGQFSARSRTTAAVFGAEYSRRPANIHEWE